MSDLVDPGMIPLFTSSSLSTATGGFAKPIFFSSFSDMDKNLWILAEEAKNDETVKMSLKELRARVHKNRA